MLGNPRETKFIGRSSGGAARQKWRVYPGVLCADPVPLGRAPRRAVDVRLYLGMGMLGGSIVQLED